MSKLLLKPLKKVCKKKRSFTNAGKIYEKNEDLIKLSLKCLCAFLLSRTSLVGGAHPLGFSFFAAVFLSGGGYRCALFSVLGLILSGCGFVTIGKYIIAITIYSLILERFLPEKYKSGKIISLIAAACVFSSGAFLLFTDSAFGGYPLIYDSVVLFVEVATVWISTRAFCVSIPLAFSMRLRHSLSPEETVSLALLTGGVLCGFGNAGIEGVLSLNGILCVLSVLIFAVHFGSLHGCSVGIIMGIVCCLSRGRIDAGAASFALSGLCAGYFARYGKIPACMSFIISNALVTIFSNGSTEVLINISDTAVAALILQLLPKRFFSSLGHFCGYAPPKIELAADKLSVVEKTLGSLENTFFKISSLRKNDDANTLILYKRTAHNACGNCGLRKYCWGRDINSTKASLEELCKALKAGEVPSPELAPEHCLRKEVFTEHFKKMFEVYKNDCLWTERINELQSAVYSGYSSIASVFRKSADGLLSESECDIAAADTLMFNLRKEGILTKSIFVCGSKEDTTVRMRLEECGGFGRCERAVCRVLEKTFNLPFVRTGIRSCDDCLHSYVVKPSFSITTAVAGAVKANRKVSGDYVIYALLDRHTYAIILCDGMGSGEIAREESKNSARLLLRFLELGLSPQDAINFVNSMLLCTGTETVTAIDLCLISLDDGSSHIYKCGGAMTYTKTGETVTYVESTGLPAGSFNRCDTDIFTVPSEKGSMVILLSDGVTATESFSPPWIKDLITSYNGEEPEAVAQMILKKAKEIGAASPEDDLTVVAAYIG